MAKSEPTEELLTCDICDETAKWNCSTCDELFCNQCQLVHVKSKATRGHQVIPVTDTPMANIPEGKSIQQEDIQCIIHPDEVYQRYCNDCKCLVCFNCCVSKHSGHNFLKITEAIKTETDTISANLNKLRDVELPAIKDILHRVKQMKVKYDEDIEESVQQIDTQAEQLKKEVDQIRDKLLRILQTRREEDHKLLANIESNLSQRISEMVTFIKSTEERMQQPSSHGILKMSNDMKQFFESYSTPELPNAPYPLTFISNKVDPIGLKSQYGYLDEHDDHKASDIDESSPAIDVKIISSFKNKFGIGYISAIGTNAWVGKRKPGTVALLAPNGTTLLFSETEETSDIAANEHGELFLAQNTSIRKIAEFSNTAPYQARGITITDNGNALVTMIHDSSFKIQRFSSTGQILNELDISTLNKSCSLKNPRYLTENVNLDIWIQDENNGKVFVIDKAGKHKFDYKGTKKEKLQRPEGLVHNKYGQILVVDRTSNVIHLVDKDGVFIQLLLAQMGLNEPIGISLDSDNNIWVGNNDGTVLVAKYLR